MKFSFILIERRSGRGGRGRFGRSGGRVGREGRAAGSCWAKCKKGAQLQYQIYPAVFKAVFHLFLVSPPLPRGPGERRTDVFARKSKVLGRCRAESGVKFSFILILSDGPAGAVGGASGGSDGRVGRPGVVGLSVKREPYSNIKSTQLYSRPFFVCFLSPLPSRGIRGEGPD